MSSNPHITECGLRGIKSIPYGVHLCHFYTSRRELVQGLVPYFEAGLRNNERCIWMTAPLPAAEARSELAKVLPLLDDMLKQDALRIFSSEEYMSAGGLNGNDIVALFLKEEEAALSAGYAGLRIAGNTSFVTPADWDAFMECERAISNALQGRRIVALCSYDTRRCGAAGALDAVRSHHCTIEQADSNWQVLTSRGGPSFSTGGLSR